MKKTKRKPMTPQFKQLVAKIRIIDPKAANWLVRNRNKAKYDMLLWADDLLTLLVWSATPQGHAYWYNISGKLNESESLLEFLKPQA